MTQNEVNIIKNSVLDATEAYVDARLANANFVKTQIGVTKGNPTKNAKGKYEHTVVCNKTAGSSGTTYTKVLSVGNIAFPKESVVFIIAPNAQYSNQFILGKLDSSPANIVGGEIHIGEITGTNEYYFNVNSTGNVTIKGADSSIQLAQDGNTNYYHVNLDKNGIRLGHASGSSYNFTVDQNGNVTIKSGSILINNKFYVTTQGNMYIGATDTSAPFYVLNTGELHATSGKISKFSIQASALGDPLNTAPAVGMISQDHIYVVDGTTSWVKMYKNLIDILNGKIKITNGTSITIDHANIFSSGQNSNVVWHSELSDEKYKKNIKEISSEKIYKFFKEISPSSFKFNKRCKDKDKLIHYGVIAQNLQYSLKKSGLNSASIVKEHNNKMLVDYQELHGLELAGIKNLYKVVQEQQKEIDMLKSKLGV